MMPPMTWVYMCVRKHYDIAGCVLRPNITCPCDTLSCLVADDIDRKSNQTEQNFRCSIRRTIVDDDYLLNFWDGIKKRLNCAPNMAFLVLCHHHHRQGTRHLEASLRRTC